MSDTNIKWSRVLAFTDEYFPGWRDTFKPIFASNALAGECGEVCNKVKKWYGGGTNPDTNDVHKLDIVEELVDVFIYRVLLCASLGYGPDDFQMAFDRKMVDLMIRMEKKKNEK